MTKHTLYRCSDCGYVTVYPFCHAEGHTVKPLSTKMANQYVALGHDAFGKEQFRRLPEPKATKPHVS